MSRTHVTCEVNGDTVDFLTDDGESLLNSLRDELGLTGAKEGCGTGDCGACSIIMNGRLQCSCLIFAPEADGAVITTCEGLASAEGPAPAAAVLPRRRRAAVRHLHPRVPRGRQGAARREP